MDSSQTALVEAVTAVVGAVSALVATYPLQTLSTIQAVQGDKRTQPRGVFQLSVVQDLTLLCETRGWHALFSGLQAAIVGTIVSQGVYQYLYALIRAHFTAVASKGDASGARRQEISVAGSLLTASLAGCGNVLLTNPIWLVQTRMQTSPQGRGSFMDVVSQLFQEDGILALWRGVVPSIVMVLNPTVQYGLYEYGVSQCLAIKRRKAVRSYKAPGAVTLTSLDIFVLSALAKLGATVSTYPLLVIKNRMQAARKPERGESHVGTYQTIVSVYKGEGIWGFFKGIRAKMLQSVLAGALMFVIKERLFELTAAGLAVVSKEIVLESTAENTDKEQ